MIRPAALIALTALANVASSARATPPPPPAPHTWVRIGWECPNHQRSFLEVEQLAQGDLGYKTRVVALVISGRSMDPATMPGFQEMAARRNFLRLVGGYCERSGETIAIEELANGPKSAEAGWRNFYIAYGSPAKE
jgi:hypothetical protein